MGKKPNNKPKDKGASNQYQPSQGVQAMENAVTFINGQVLGTGDTETSINNGLTQKSGNNGNGSSSIKSQVVGSAKAMADQAAAMMVEDVQTFMKGTQQFMTIAMAQAAAKIVKTDGAEGETAMTDLIAAMNGLATYAGNIGNVSANIMSGTANPAPKKTPPPALVTETDPEEAKDDVQELYENLSDQSKDKIDEFLENNPVKTDEPNLESTDKEEQSSEEENMNKVVSDLAKHDKPKLEALFKSIGDFLNKGNKNKDEED